MRKMDIRWVKVVIAGIFAEIFPIASLVVMVALFGPGDQPGAQEFAVWLGFYVGPIGGALFAFLMAFGTARTVSSSHVLHGFLIGLVAALLDASILIASSAAFQWIFVISGIGRLAAGTLGGIAAKQARK